MQGTSVTAYQCISICQWCASERDNTSLPLTNDSFSTASHQHCTNIPSALRQRSVSLRSCLNGQKGHGCLDLTASSFIQFHSYSFIDWVNQFCRLVMGHGGSTTWDHSHFTIHVLMCSCLAWWVNIFLWHWSLFLIIEMFGMVINSGQKDNLWVRRGYLLYLVSRGGRSPVHIFGFGLYCS